MQALKKLDEKEKLLDKRKKSLGPGQTHETDKNEPTFEELALMEND